jgi:hypothetical protein
MTKSHVFAIGERGECQNSPLIAPFMFLSQQSDKCLSCKLRFADVVAADFAQGMILPNGKESNGLIHVAAPGLPLGNQPTLWSISVDETGDSFTPRSIIRTIPGFGQQAAYTLLGYTNLGEYKFPTTIAWSASGYSGTSSPSLLSTGMITVVSMRVPEHVPDATFQLDEELAVTIWDSDQGKFTKSGPPSDRCPAYLRLYGSAEHQRSTNAQPAISPLPHRP